MTAEQRIEFFKRAVELAKQTLAAIRHIPPACQPFNDALRARTPWVIVTPAIVMTNIVIFVFMLFGSGSFSDPNTLLAWGASVGPRTTNGEWWRLVTCSFVHAGMVHVLASTAGTLRVGL